MIISKAYFAICRFARLDFDLIKAAPLDAGQAETRFNLNAVALVCVICRAGNQASVIN